MGMFHSAYFAYGFQISDVEPEQLEEAELGDGVSFLLAGGYDRDMTFLTTECKNADLGKYERVTPQAATDEQRAAWNVALRNAAARLGVTPETEPSWFVVPDMS